MKLREFYSIHARVYGTSAEDAYELLRALKTDERFPKTRSGPGGGIDATPFTVTYYTIAELINGSRKDIVDRISGYWNTPVEGIPPGAWREGHAPAPLRCDFTGKAKFGDALEAVIANENLASRVIEIGACRSIREGWISYHADGEVKVSRFIKHHDVDIAKSGVMRVQSVIGGSAIHAIARDIRGHSDE